MNCKYIIFADETGWEYPILFPQTIDHNRIKGMNPTDTPVSAGMVNIFDDTVKVGVGSMTLKLEYREKDAGIIKSKFGVM